MVVSVAGALALSGGGTLADNVIESAAGITSCTPGYSPCIANKSSDVDCKAGSGNGPRYTRRGVVYSVKAGYDRYRLDADHDGKGCEKN